MVAAPKKPLPAPDGDPAAGPRGGARDGEGTRKSKVSEVQDPLIAGDAGKDTARTVAGEATVDEAGQLRRKDRRPDLLH